MTSDKRRAGDDRLASRWRAWMQVLETCADNEQDGLSYSREHYRALQTEIMQICQDEITRNTGRARICKQMLRLVSPWRSLGAFSACKRDILDKLYLQSEAVCAVLEGRHRRFSLGTRERRIAAAALIAAAAILLLMVVTSPERLRGLPAMAQIEFGLSKVRYAVSHWETQQLIVAAGVAGVLAFAAVMWRVRRTA